jgi:hypothetical protein
MMSAVFVGPRMSASKCIGLISIATFGYSGELANLLAVPGDVFRIVQWPLCEVSQAWGQEFWE